MSARPAARGAPSARPVGGRGPDQRIAQDPYEVSGKLKKSGRTVIDSNGNAGIPFVVDNAWQRWEVTEVVVSTDQAATAIPVPAVTVYVNDPSSAGNSEGYTASGNGDTMTGLINVGPCDQLHVTWRGGIPGSVCTTVLTGTRYTRRA